MHLPLNVCALAARQHAVVSRAQLVRLPGVTPDAVDGWVRRGLLVRVARGVYVVPGAPVVPERRATAAVLRSGIGARVTGKAACGLHALEGFHPDCRPTIIVPPSRRVEAVRFIVHRTHLPPVDCESVRGVPAVSATRALIDAAREGVGGKPLRVGLDDAVRKGLARHDRVVLRAEQLPYHPGAAAVRALYATGDMRMESEGERAMASLFASFPLQPEWGVWVCGNRYRLDAYWPLARLAAEYDGRDRHLYGTNLDEDHTRRLGLLDAGILSIAISYAMVRDTPEQTAARVRRVLEQRLAQLA